MVKVLDEKGFQENVINAPGREIVEFYSATAQDSSDALDKAAAETAGQTDFFRIDIDKAKALGDKYVKGETPYFVLFEAGMPISEASGELSGDQLEKMSLVGEFGMD